MSLVLVSFMKLEQLGKVFEYLRLNADLLIALHTEEAGIQNLDQEGTPANTQRKTWAV